MTWHMELHFLSACVHAVQLGTCQFAAIPAVNSDHLLLVAGELVDVHLTGPAHQLLGRRAECNPAANSVWLCGRSQVICALIQSLTAW